MWSRTAHIDNEEAFKALRERPTVAWPTVLLLLACLSAIGWSWYACLTDQLPLWAGLLINTVAMYYLFSPMHDAMHGAVSKYPWLNSAVLFLAVLPIVPLATGRFLRFMHMQHHRFANDDADPDHLLSMKPSHALGKWFFWGHLYKGFYLRNRDKLPEFSARIMRREEIAALGSQLVLLIICPWETLMLMIIPSFFFAWLITFVFMFLPHYPHDVKHKDDPYRATAVRVGWEWLLCPLMAYQNYHLVHHLYPTVPFYRYKKVWESRLTFHMSKNPAIIPAFGLSPRPPKSV